MSGLPVVLDAAGLDELAASRPSDLFRELLAEAHRRGREVLVPTVVCAEVARGPARTRALEAALARHARSTAARQPVRLVDTDLVLAKQVAAVLHAAGLGSAHIVDAHVVAVAVPAGGALIVTADPGDVALLADAVPAARIRTVTV